MTNCHGNAWFALRTKSNMENMVAMSLCGRGYDMFLPRRRAGAQRRVQQRGERPLFPGYVFCHFNQQNRLPILAIPGVLHIVGCGREPVAIPDDEIFSLKRLLETQLPIEEHESFHCGQKVNIRSGPLTGTSGVVINVQNNRRLVVGITLLQRAVSVVFDADVAEALN